jgi:hypothetical protein
MAPVRASQKQKDLHRICGSGDNSDEDGKEEQRRRKCHYYNYTVKQKIAIVQAASSKPRYVAKFARMKGMPHDHTEQHS